MQIRTYLSVIVIVFAASFLGFLADSLYAYDILVIKNISFGEIIPVAANEIIEIDAHCGPSAPTRAFTSGPSYLKNGHSGIIRFEADKPGQLITIEYPTSVVLKSNGHSELVIDGISSRSTVTAVSNTMGPVDFHIGGLLHIHSNCTGKNFSGTIPINITVDNP